jgi:hypothetical protein
MPNFSMQSFLIVAGVSTLAKSDSFTAASDNAAVDAARATHDSIVPNVGGDYEIVVTAIDPGVSEMVRDATTGAYIPRPPGEISRFGVSHEPDPSVRDAVYAQRAAADAAAADAALRESIRAEVVAAMVAAAPSDAAKQTINAAADAAQAAAVAPDVQAQAVKS